MTRLTLKQEEFVLRTKYYLLLCMQSVILDRNLDPMASFLMTDDYEATTRDVNLIKQDIKELINEIKKNGSNKKI